MDSKLTKKDRMNRAKDSKDKKPEKDADKSKLKKRGGGFAPPEDDDLDSRGNLRGLIAYTDESEYLSEEESPRQKKRLQPKSLQSAKRKAKKPSVSDEEDDDEEDDIRRPVRRGFQPRKAAVKASEKIKRKLKKAEPEEEEDSEDDDYEDSEEQPTTLESEEEDEEEEDDEDDEDEDEDDEDSPPRNRILLNFGFGDSSSVDERMVPKRYKIKKESESVQKFFKLMTEPIETETIDDHIDQFKALKEDDQKRMLTVLENRPKAKDQPVMFKILNMRTTPEIQANLLAKYNTLQSMEPGSGEYFKMRNWLEKAISLPLGTRKDIPAKVEDGPEICQAFMTRAKKCLDEAIYGQEESKLQILQFIAGKITNPDSRGMSLLLVGPPGIGKTSLIKQGIAKALDWPFQFISLGGDSDASTFSGHQLVYEGSHCGKIVNSLVAAKSMSMVLMFDELDKISSTPKGEEIQNLLVHLTDPTQNSDFEDKYLSGIPLDLSQAMFVFSANDINKIDRVLLDRFLVVELEGYGPKEKTEIAEKFLLPGALKEVSLAERIGIPKDVVTHIMENYAKEEKGVRELKRCMEQIAQKLNMLRLFNSPDLPFHIKDFSLPFILKKEHVDKFLKDRKAKVDTSFQKMYT
jgi:ATP-dependent Clp protease ATP-binding subunit ClpA